MANSRYHVLNPSLEDCPDFVAGELFISGDGLAHGYLGDPALTAARFIPHPRTGERLYRSGDRGRYLPSGELEFLGRDDLQVKAGGVRVELGEVEAALLAHERVRAAAAVVAGTRLVAFVVADRSLEQAGYSAPPPPDPALRDPAARLDFKLGRPGLRRDLEATPLPLPRSPESSAEAAYLTRRSYRRFLEHPLALGRLGALLGCLAARSITGLPLPKYRYGSGGGLYGVQTYLYVRQGRVEGLQGGTYYYDPQGHALVGLAQGVAMGREAHVAENREAFERSAVTLLLVERGRAVEPLYGEMARQFCLLEAGAMSQLLMEVGPGLGVGLCPVGLFDFEAVRQWLRLESGQELLYSLLAGPIEGRQLEAAGLIEELAEGARAGASAGRGAAGGRQLGRQLREYLRGRLPGASVPARVEVVRRLPLTGSGKVDRVALAEMAGRLQWGVGAAAVGPRTQLEEAIAGVWREVLGVSEVGVEESFFELGGDSLQLARVWRQLREERGWGGGVVELFRYPTIASLAAHWDMKQQQDFSIEEINERVRKQITALEERRNRREVNS